MLYFHALRFYQPVRIDRLDRSIIVPTYVKAGASMEREQDISEGVRANLNKMIRKFIADARTANEMTGD